MSESSAFRTDSERCPECEALLPPTGEQLVCQSCGALFFRQPLPPGAVGQRQLVRGMHLQTYSCPDTQGVGMEAFSLLIPAGWEFSGGVQWNMLHTTAPAGATFQVRNPYGQEALEGLPALPFTWSNNPILLSAFPVGSLYLGSEVRPPMGILQALREVVIPRYRGQEVGAQVVREELLPDLVRQLGKGPGGAQADPYTPWAQMLGINTTYEGGRLRLRYRHGDVVLEEEMYGLVETTHFYSTFMFSTIENVFWNVDHLAGVRGLAEILDKLADLFRVMAFSVHINPEWLMRYRIMVQNMVQNQIWQSNYISQMGRWRSQMYSESYSGYMPPPPYIPYQPPVYYPVYPPPMPGMQRPYNPFEEGGLAIPTDARYGWTNDRGEFIFTADQRYDPNMGDGQGWRRLRGSTRGAP